MFAGFADPVGGQDYAVKLKTNVINRWLTFWGKRKQLPVGDLSLVGKGWVSSSVVEQGKVFLTETGHWVKVIDVSYGFMDVGVFVEYDNGALRWLFLEDIPFREPVK